MGLIDSITFPWIFGFSGVLCKEENQHRSYCWIATIWKLSIQTVVEQIKFSVEEKHEIEYRENSASLALLEHSDYQNFDGRIKMKKFKTEGQEEL